MRQHFEGRRPRPPPLVTVRTYSPSQTFRWNVWDERTFTGVSYLVRTLKLCGVLRFHRNVRLLSNVRNSPWHWGLPQCRASAECRSAWIIKPLCGIGGQAAENGLHRNIGECRGGSTSRRNICFILLYHKYKPPSIGGLYKILV